MADVIAPPVAAPVIPAADLSLTARIATYEQDDQQPAKVDTPVAPVVDEKAAAADADSTKPDADLSEAGRKLRSHRLDVRAEKLRIENDTLARELQRRQELHTLRSELERSAPAQHPAAGGAPAGTTAATAADPRDPEPTFEAFSTANPAHVDPYAGFLRAQAAWDRRQEQRAFVAEHEQRQQVQGKQAAVASYQTRADAMRAQHSDFDAVTSPFLEQYANHPYAPDLAGFLSADPDGAKVLYHLGKHEDAVRALFTPGIHPLVSLGAIKALVLGTASRAATTSTAPAPPSQTVGAGATTLHDDDSATGLTTGDRFRIWRAQDEARAARGLR